MAFNHMTIMNFVFGIIKISSIIKKPVAHKQCIGDSLSSKKRMNKLETLIGLIIAEERGVENDVVRKRDREFGLREDVRGLPDLDKIAQWLHEPYNDEARNEAKRYSDGLNLFSWLAASIFFLIGFGAAGLAFYYDGEKPINVLPILLLFVIIPFGLLLISVVTRLTSKYFINDNAEGGIIRFWESMLGMFAGRLSHKNREKVDNARNFFSQLASEHGDLVRTYILKTIQKAGIAYVMGALLWVMVNVITTDLAFSWSSTLNMGPQHMHTFTETMATPWKGWFSAAVVDYETIEKTRYFRASEDVIPVGATAYDLGGWWPFLLMSLITYSFLPRLAAFTYYKTQLDKKAGNAITRSQEGQSLLQRLDTPYIITDVGENDNSRHWEPISGNHHESINSTPSSCVLMWNFGEYDFDINQVLYKLGIPKADVYSLGGVNTLSEDDQIIARVASAFKNIDHKQHLIVLVEYWESADVDFEKMLKKLRTAFGQKLIRIIPVAMNESEIRESNKINWLNKIQHTKDPLIRFDHDSKILLAD